jgi:hypothetical protein
MLIVAAVRNTIRKCLKSQEAGLGEEGQRFCGHQCRLLLSGLRAALSYLNRNALATGLHCEGELGVGTGQRKRVSYLGCVLMLRLQNILSITM